MLNKTKRGEERTWTLYDSLPFGTKKRVSEFLAAAVMREFQVNVSGVILKHSLSLISASQLSGWDVCGHSFHFPFFLKCHELQTLFYMQSKTFCSGQVDF